MTSDRIAVIRQGDGPEVLLVHGGASPATTWSGLERLAGRWTLSAVHRRGYPPSPPAVDGRQDFAVDADDLTALLDGRPHVVAHSYGAVGALIAAARDPGRVRSLTLLEPALFLDLDDPGIARLKELAEHVLTHGLDSDAATLREFLTVAGARVDDGPLPEDVAQGVRRAHGARRPWDAPLALDVIREADIPTLVASGGHTPAAERMCDAAAGALYAQRIVTPGGGHFVAAARGFADQLEQFMIAAGAAA